MNEIRLLRTRVTVLIALASALLVPALLVPAGARADTSASLTVVGTSDVSDSGLVPNLIQPEFTKIYPQFTFKYIGTATGTAITDAETGSVGASALIVHAASLENQFVAGGYSYLGYGNAIFTNDFVLAGPTGDPAGVGTAGANDIAQAFTAVAAAGINGGGTPRATFVSRGGTPGTTVQEHQIWQNVAGLANPPAGLLLCAVAAKSGGGDTPISAGQGVTADGQPCPNSGALPTGAALPAWYVTTGLTQGPNVVAANACNGYPSGANSCYVFTDRGTYDFLTSGTDPAGSIPSLKIVTRGPQAASAPGGVNGLVNYFHAYIINPSMPGESVNLTAARDFVNFLTSPTFQAELKGYLAHTSDPAGPPFVADASPIITASGFPTVARGDRSVTVSGTVANAEPGYPAPAGKPVSIDEIEGGLPVPVGSGVTDSSGRFRISFTPVSSGSYEVTTPQISQIENPNLNPVFGDVLSPAATAPVTMTVQAELGHLKARVSGRRLRVTGSVAPGSGHLHATVTLLARRAGHRHAAFKKVASERLRTNAATFALTRRLRAGGWQVKVRFDDPRQVRSTTSRTLTVTVGAGGGRK
jgi:tungstate transport system substrate-binding protein